jgi:hypothetical protein
VLAWFLAMTLWLPVFNERNTYRDVAIGLRDALAAAPDDCVATRGLGPAQRASFMYFARPQFQREADGGDAGACGWLLIQDDGPITRTKPDVTRGATLVWQGQRRPNVGERFRLYRIEDDMPAAGPGARQGTGGN